MMRFQNGFVVAALTAVLVGCSRPPAQQQSTTVSGPVASNTKPSTDANAKPQIDGGSKAPTGDTGKPLEPSTPTQPGQPSATNRKPTATPPVMPGGRIKSYDANWRPSAASAIDIAGKTDKVLKSLSNVEATLKYRLKNKAGEAIGTLEEKIKAPNTFALQYPMFYEDKHRGMMPAVAHAKSDGKVLKEEIEDITNSRSAGSSKAPPKDLAQDWPTLASREVFAGLLDNRQPFSEYVNHLLDKKNGYETKVLERTLNSNRGPVRQYSIVAVRKGPSAAILGTSAVELIIDADIYLPVTMSAMVKKPGATVEDSVGLSAQWRRQTKFGETDFKHLPTTKTSS